MIVKQHSEARIHDTDTADRELVVWWDNKRS